MHRKQLLNLKTRQLPDLRTFCFRHLFDTHRMNRLSWSRTLFSLLPPRYKFLIELPSDLDLKRCYLTGAEISIYFPYFFIQVHAPSSNYMVPRIYYTHTVGSSPPPPLRTINYNLNSENHFTA